MPLSYQCAMAERVAGARRSCAPTEVAAAQPLTRVASAGAQRSAPKPAGSAAAAGAGPSVAAPAEIAPVGRCVCWLSSSFKLVLCFWDTQPLPVGCQSVAEALSASDLLCRDWRRHSPAERLQTGL